MRDLDSGDDFATKSFSRLKKSIVRVAAERSKRQLVAGKRRFHGLLQRRRRGERLISPHTICDCLSGAPFRPKYGDVGGPKRNQ